MINFIISRPGSCTETISIGPVLRNLVSKTRLETESRIDYSEWFPLLTKLGYTCSHDLIYSLFKLYLTQNNLMVDGLSFIMDDTLKYPFTIQPGLYDIITENNSYNISYIKNMTPMFQ